jgi:hypothetical protein
MTFKPSQHAAISRIVASIAISLRCLHREQSGYGHKAQTGHHRDSGKRRHRDNPDLVLGLIVNVGLLARVKLNGQIAPNVPAKPAEQFRSVRTGVAAKGLPANSGAAFWVGSAGAKLRQAEDHAGFLAVQAQAIDLGRLRREADHIGSLHRCSSLKLRFKPLDVINGKWVRGRP